MQEFNETQEPMKSLHDCVGVQNFHVDAGGCHQGASQPFAATLPSQEQQKDAAWLNCTLLREHCNIEENASDKWMQHKLGSSCRGKHNLPMRPHLGHHQAEHTNRLLCPGKLPLACLPS